MFDTGATTTLVSPQAARRAGVTEADMTPAPDDLRRRPRQAEAWTAPFDTVRARRRGDPHNRLQVADFKLADADMLMGIDFFLSHRIYVSKKQSKMFFTYNGGPCSR